jgi:Fe2+ transport system protein B
MHSNNIINEINRILKKLVTFEKNNKIKKLFTKEKINWFNKFIDSDDYFLVKKYGINDIIDYMDDNYYKFLENKQQVNNKIVNMIDKRINHIRVAQILEKIKLNDGSPSIVTEKLDKVLLHPFFGTVILLFILLFLFQAVFSWATIPKEILQGWFDFFQQKINYSVARQLLGAKYHLKVYQYRKLLE